MNPDEALLFATIQDHGTLKGMDPHHIHRLAGLALEAQFEPGQVIFHRGDDRHLLYLICSGSVLLLSDSEEHPVQRLGSGDILGWSALLEGAHRHFEARCVSRVHALAFEGQELQKMLDADPRFGYAFLKRILAVLVQRLEAASRSVAVQGAQPGIG